MTCNIKQIWWQILTQTSVIKFKEVTSLKTVNDEVSKIDINSYSKSINSDNRDNSDSSDNISEDVTLTTHTTMSNDHEIISESHLTIFKILTRISSILTSALKTFINENEKWSVSSTKTAITDVNWISLRSVNENRSKRIIIRSLKMWKADAAIKTAVSYWSIRFSECQINLKNSQITEIESVSKQNSVSLLLIS